MIDPVKRLAHFVFLKSYLFYIFFVASYIYLILLNSYVAHPANFPVEGLPKQLRNVHITNPETIGHFLLRAASIIEGGEFKGYDKNIMKVIPELVFALIILYLIELLIFRAVMLIRKKLAKSYK